MVEVEMAIIGLIKFIFGHMKVLDEKIFFWKKKVKLINYVHN